MPKNHVISYVLLLLSAVAYIALAYATPRTEFTQLLLLYTFAFAAYVYVVNQKLPIWHSIGVAILFRLLFLFAEPALSDDFYRFIWDGRLILAGENPFLHLPAYYIQDAASPIVGISNGLFKHLNSKEYYSVYPPVSQGVFWLAAKFSPDNIMGSVIVMRLLIIMAEAGSILLLLRLLRKMALSEKQLLLYAFNPLVIIELTGNLHFEALMIFFVLLTLHQLYYQRIYVAGAALGLAIGTKLLPLIFLPFLLRKLELKRFIGFAIAMLLVLLMVFLPFISWQGIQHIFQSLDLYFQRFEFNASIYYLLRWLGFRLTGYNQIQLIGPFLSLLTLVVVLVMASVKKLGSIRRLSGYMAASLTVYLLLATTVHPWYISTLIALTVLSQFRYAVVWSGLLILTYAAYRTPDYQEDLILVTVEYAIVFLWLIAELYLYRNKRNSRNLKDTTVKP